MEKLKKYIESAVTGLDAIQRAPIVDYETDLRCLRIGDISQLKQFNEWGFTSTVQEDVSQFLIKKDDNFIARTGSTIGCSYFSKKSLNSVFNNGIIRLRTTKEMLPQYLSFLIQTNDFRKYVNNVGMASATQPNIKINGMLDYELEVPLLQKQQHIVNTIGSVDDLIEKKHEILIKIEEISNIIFQKAVLNGNNITLSNFISFEKGRQVTFSETGFPYLNIDSLELIPTLFSNDQGIICNDHDILMVMDGASSGNVYIGNSGIVGATLAKIKTTLNSFYLYLYFKRNFNLIQSMNTGSAIPHANKKAIGDLIVKYNDTYNEKFEHLFQMWVRLKKEIKTLKIIKDKLIKKYF